MTGLASLSSHKNRREFKVIDLIKAQNLVLPKKDYLLSTTNKQYLGLLMSTEACSRRVFADRASEVLVYFDFYGGKIYWHDGSIFEISETPIDDICEDGGFRCFSRLIQYAQKPARRRFNGSQLNFAATLTAYFMLVGRYSPKAS